MHPILWFTITAGEACHLILLEKIINTGRTLLGQKIKQTKQKTLKLSLHLQNNFLKTFNTNP